MYSIAIRRGPDTENGSSADRNSCDTAACTGDGRLPEVAGGGDDITGSTAMATGSVLPQPVDDGRIDPPPLPERQSVFSGHHVWKVAHDRVAIMGCGTSSTATGRGRLRADKELYLPSTELHFNAGQMQRLNDNFLRGYENSGTCARQILHCACVSHHWL